MMQRKYISFLLLTFLLFAALSSYGNLPDGTPKNGKDKPGLTMGNDGGDGAGEQNRYSICG
jgi:hypothetical protein